jgi:hypothetical protein
MSSTYLALVSAYHCYSVTLCDGPFFGWLRVLTQIYGLQLLIVRTYGTVTQTF